MSGIQVLVDAQDQHEYDFIPRENRGNILKVIYFLHLYITPCTESGAEFLKYTIRKALDVKIPGDLKNVGTSH